MFRHWMIVLALIAAGPVLAQEAAPVFSGVVRMPDGKPAAGAVEVHP